MTSRPRTAGGPDTATVSARQDLVEATRALASAVGRTGVDEARMRGLAARLRELVPDLEESRLPRVPRTAFADAVGAPDYAWQRDNPALPGVEIRFVEGMAHAELPDGLDHLFEGPEDLVHGGVAAMLMDVVLSSLVQFHGIPCVTASLTVEFRRPTPLRRALTLTGRLDEVHERKALASGTVLYEGGVTIEARGVFVRVDRGRPGTG
ncbi:PaaI family thioesterase [Streptomyces sp. NPDC057580]|uniref:PaaI family thioesterase n=1 Tax=Streptomyces sp. NPDC057580 TaxID=3346173 RepID=UPI0036C3B527